MGTVIAQHEIMSRARRKLTLFDYHGYDATRESCVSQNGQRGTKFQAVILDYGAVLCHEPLPHEIEFIASAFHVSPAEFPALYGSARHDYDRGDISTPEYWAALARQTGVTLAPETLDRLCHVDKEMWSRINTEMTSWLATLRPAGYQTALLSNMQHDMIAHVRAKFPWLSDFDHQIFSAEVRTIKPDAAIYHHCLRLLKVEPRAAIFVDDRAENVATARSLGIEAFQFRSVDELRRDLKAAGFSHLP
jgi:putative hydrolase of the HAD superfamily